MSAGGFTFFQSSSISNLQFKFKLGTSSARGTHAVPALPARKAAKETAMAQNIIVALIVLACLVFIGMTVRKKIKSKSCGCGCGCGCGCKTPRKI